jgi:multidrug efflux pump subunit AcrA (membrane-fusion protein)
MKKKKSRKWIYIFLVIIVICVTVFFMLKSKVSVKVAEKKDIETIKPTKGKVESLLSTTGEVRLLKTVKVKSDISGTVKTIYFQDGDKVEKGQLLALLEPDKNELLNLYNKRANVQNSLITLEDAKAELDKKKEIYDKIKGSSLDEIERLQRKFKATETSYKLALLELKVLEDKLNIRDSGSDPEPIDITDGSKFKGFEDFKVLAPLSGVIVNKLVEEGELVVSGISSTIEGTNLCVIGDLSKLVVYCNVNEIDVPKIRLGFPTKITVDGLPNEFFNGKVKRIATQGSLNSSKTIVTYGVEIELLSSGAKLKPAMTCDVKITMESKVKVLQIPFESVLEEDDKKWVYVKKGEKFDQKEVKLGLDGLDNIELISGIDEKTSIAKNVEDVLELEDVKKAKEEKAKKEAEKNGNNYHHDDEGDSR